MRRAPRGRHASDRRARSPRRPTRARTAQAANALVVSAAALAVREGELGAVAHSLDPDEADVLLKYVYRALSTPSDKAAAWLRWHAALVERAGPGAIMRVITEVGHTA